MKKVVIFFFVAVVGFSSLYAVEKKTPPNATLEYYCTNDCVVAIQEAIFEALNRDREKSYIIKMEENNFNAELYYDKEYDEGIIFRRNRYEELKKAIVYHDNLFRLFYFPPDDSDGLFLVVEKTRDNFDEVMYKSFFIMRDDPATHYG